jgi:hypothetical protein
MEYFVLVYKEINLILRKSENRKRGKRKTRKVNKKFYLFPFNHLQYIYL